MISTNLNTKNKLYNIAKNEKNIQKSKMSKREIDRRAIEWQRFYLDNLDIFTEEYLEIKLHEFQRGLLLQCGYNDINDIIASRGLSKSFCISILANNLALLLPNVNILVTSLTLQQSNIIIEEKIDKMLTSPTSKLHSPVLKQLRQDGYIQFKKDKTSGGLIVEYGNGSKIFAVNCGESARGKRSNIVIVDEAVLIKKTEYDEIIEPTLEPYEFNGMRLEPKQIFLTSAKTQDNWMWRHLVNTVNNHYKNKRIRYGFFAGDIFTAVANKVQTVNQYLSRRQNSDDFAFSTEYLNLWLGESKDAILKYLDFHDAQLSETPFYPTTIEEYISGNKRRLVKDDNEVRCLISDIAVVGGKENDNTILMLGTINVETGMRRIDYLTAKNGLNSVKQAIYMKRLFYDYECDYFVMDTKGVGNVIYDILTLETEDKEFGVTYPAWTVNLDKQLQISSDTVVNEKYQRAIEQNGEGILVPYAGTNEINSMLHYAMWNTLRNKRLLLLKDKSNMEVILQEKDTKFFTKDSEEKANILMPFQETDLMISETIALNITRDANNKLVAHEPRMGTKDRYMTMGMFNYFGDKVCNKYMKNEESTSDDDIDWDNISLVV